MSSDEYEMISKKIPADIDHLMKLAKSTYKTRTESEGLRAMLNDPDADTAEFLRKAQKIAEIHGQSVDSDDAD
jgi:hypothetical protein